MNTRLNIITVLILFTISLTANAQSVTNIANNATYGSRRPLGYGFYNSEVNKTVVSWNGESMSVYCREYDHTSKVWGTTTKVFTLNYNSRNDYHNYSNLIKAPSGKYLTFYADHSNRLFQIESPNANSISGVWTRKQIGNDRNAYPKPIVAGNDIFLFYSRNDDISHPYRSYKYIKSSDNGATWSSPTTIINTNKNDPDRYDEVYANHISFQPVINGNFPKIHITWIMKGGPNGHNKGSKSAYFAYLNVSNGNMYSPDGSNLNQTVDYGLDLDKCRVIDYIEPTNPYEIVNPISSFKMDGTFIVTYGRDGSTYVKEWNGNTWSEAQLVAIGDSHRDMYKSGPNSFKVAIVNNGHLHVYESLDGTSTWSQSYFVDIPYSNGANRITCAFIEDHQEEVQILGQTFNYDQRKQDYSGKWPVIAFGKSPKLEVESLPTISSGATQSDFNDINASGGAVNKLNADNVGDYIEYTFDIQNTGSYLLKVGVKNFSLRGIFQASFPQTGENVGDPIDMYSQDVEYMEINLGACTFQSSGNKTIRFTVTGKNINSSNYSLVFDYIQLLQVVSPELLLFETESTVKSSFGATQEDIDDINASNNKANKLSGNSIGDYVQYEFMLPNEGDYNIYVGAKKHNSRGIFQFSLPQADANVGTSHDLYSSDVSYEEINLGSYDFLSSGNKEFRFTVTGKNSNSSDYTLMFDYIKLVPSNSASRTLVYSKDSISNKIDLVQRDDSYLEVYPIPASQTLKIKYLGELVDGGASILIRDIRGSVVLDRRNIFVSSTNIIEVAVDNLVKGHYVLELYHGQLRLQKRIIIY